MTSVKRTNAMFRKARKNDGKVDTKEAKAIAKVLKRGTVTASEGKAVAKQLAGKGKDTFSAGARELLGQLASQSAGRPSSNPATSGSSAKSTASSAGRPPAPAGRDVADDAIRAIGDLKEPAIPGPDATPQQLAQYEKDTKRYDRMMELMSNVIKKRDELQMSIVRKM